MERLNYEHWYYHTYHLAEGINIAIDCKVCNLKDSWYDKQLVRNKERRRREREARLKNDLEKGSQSYATREQVA